MNDLGPDLFARRQHFRATFFKFSMIAGLRRTDSIADVVLRAAEENQSYLEIMFNIGTRIGGLAADIWTQRVRVQDLPLLLSQLKGHPSFQTQMAIELTALNSAYDGYRALLRCDADPNNPGCNVKVRFIAQVSRTLPSVEVFGALVGAFELAAQDSLLVAANLASPEEDPAALANFGLQMEMLKFLRNTYTHWKKSFAIEFARR